MSTATNPNERAVKISHRRITPLNIVVSIRLTTHSSLACSARLLGFRVPVDHVSLSAAPFTRHFRCQIAKFPYEVNVP